jgi:Uma2 family endonuclease
MPVGERLFEQVASEDPEGRWELLHGRLVQRDDMTAEHNDAIERLESMLYRQLDLSRYAIRGGTSRLYRPDGEATGQYFLPDLYVVPRSYVHERREAEPGRLEVYRDPALLVVEVWSPSTGAYDARTMLPEYQARGDAEIWLVQPYARSVTIWQRTADGSYTERRVTEGVIAPAAVPDCRIEVERLFE